MPHPVDAPPAGPSFPKQSRLLRRSEFVAVQTHEMSNPNYTSNPTNRCYYCKFELFTEMEQVIREREVGMILLGNPINMRGSEGRQSVWVREFAESLEKRTRLPVKLWDERLTSVEAGRVLRSSGISIEKRAAAVDRLSAVILLQSYLDYL